MSEKFSEIAWKNALPIINKIKKHPMIIELINGVLNEKKFENYVVQDILYLIDYEIILKNLSKRLKIETHKAKFLKHSIGTKECLEYMRKEYIQPFNMKEVEIKSPACSEYINFLYENVNNKSIEEALVSCLPCFWVYDYIGRFMYKNHKKPNKYEKWFSDYKDDKESKSVKEYIDICNNFAENNPSALNSMIETFKKGCECEYNLWNESYTDF